MHASEVRSSEARTYNQQVVLAGAGAAVPAKTFGNGVVVARLGVGVYRLTFGDALGPFLGIAGFMFGDAVAPENVKGYTLTRGAYNAAGRYVDIYVWTSAFAAADLAPNQSLDLVARLKLSSV
jgi:hypothetical protein